MKIKILFLLASMLFATNVVLSQNELPFRIQAQTDTINVINDTFEVSYSLIKRLDSLSFTIDSIFYITCDEIEFLSNSLDTGNYSGDSVEEYSMVFLYDSTSKPFYLEEIRVYMIVNGIRVVSNFWVFFTPWNTIEVFSDAQMPSNRRWLANTEFDSINKCYINPNSLPGPADTSLPLCYKYIEGLAYAVLTNCDTLGFDTFDENYYLVYDNNPDTFEINYFRTSEKYKGTITGRLIYKDYVLLPSSSPHNLLRNN